MAFEKKIILSLDIGSSMIRAGVGYIQKNGQLRVLEIIERQSDCIRKGRVVNQEQFEKVIKSVISEAELQSGTEVSKIVTGIGGGSINCFVNTGVVGISADVPAISTSDIKRAMENSCNIEIPDDSFVLHTFAREFSVDGKRGIKNPDGMTGHRLECETLIITASIQSRNDINECFVHNRFPDTRFTLQSYSDGEIVLSQEEKTDGVILINLGSGSSNMAAYKNGNMVFAGGIDIGGNNITNDIAVLLDKPLAYAEQVKKEFGCCYEALVNPKETLEITKGQRFLAPKLKRGDLVEIIQKRMTEIFTKLKGLLVKNGWDEDSFPAGVILTGGGALLSGAVNLAGDVFNSVAKIGFPDVLPGLDRSYISPQYATLLGQLKLCGKGYRSRFPKFRLVNKKQLFTKKILDFIRTVF